MVVILSALVFVKKEQKMASIADQEGVSIKRRDFSKRFYEVHDAQWSDCLVSKLMKKLLT